ncbi:MAG: transposase [Clostridia bacterium]|nr:transposase [Clostridia bacterium]
MNKITQDMLFRQSLLKYSEKNGVTKAAIKYKVNRQYVYRWKRRYDGSLESLREKSHRPKSHPNQHTEAELKLINDMRRRNPNAGLVVFWVKLRQRGYTRSITGLYRVLVRRGEMAVKPPNPKYIPKKYEQMQYPGQRIQIDVKFVPAACITKEGDKYYQYTAIDEYSRYRYLEAFQENSTYSSAQFASHVIEHFARMGIRVECIQTDNGFEFTKRFGGSAPGNLTLFEACLKQYKVQHKLIRPFTPRHNGKVERSHRKDNEYFYATHKFYSFNDFKRQLAIHNRNYNLFPIRPLGWRSPKQVLNMLLSTGELL